MDGAMTYGLSMERIIEDMRGLAAVHVMSRGGESPLELMMCEGRRALLERRVKDAFTECVARLEVRAVDIDIDSLTVGLAVGRGVRGSLHLLVGRALEQMVASRAMSLWASMAGMDDMGTDFEALASRWGRRLGIMLSGGGATVRPAWG